MNISNEQLHTFKTALENERDTVVADLARIGGKTKDGDWQAVPPEIPSEDRSDENDVADRFEDFAERSSVVNSLEGRLNNIEIALEKIKNSTYGICEISGEPIEEDRLRANPAARTCKKHL